MNTILREPTLIAGTVRAIILCAVTFGLRWTPEQIGAFLLAVEAVLTLVNRSVVTPVAHPKLELGTPVLVKGTDDEPPPDAVVAVR